jgi:hypothetical protein
MRRIGYTEIICGVAVHRFLVFIFYEGNTLREITILVVIKGLPILRCWGAIGVEFRRSLGGQMSHLALHSMLLVYLTSVSSYTVFIPIDHYIRVTAAAFKGELWRTPLLGGVALLDSITKIRRKPSISVV